MTDPINTQENEAGPFRRLVQFLREWRKARALKKLDAMRARKAYLDDPVRWQVMRAFGDAGLAQGASWVTERILQRIEDERSESQDLKARIERMESKLEHAKL